MQLYLEFPGVFNRSLCEEIPQDVSLEGHRAVFPLSPGLWKERRALEKVQLENLQNNRTFSHCTVWETTRSLVPSQRLRFSPSVCV